MIRVFKAPHNEAIPVKVFLAGTIDMGNSEDWQEIFTNLLHEVSRKSNVMPNTPDIHIFNPRRNDWDSSWDQSIDNSEFNEQVTWELTHIEDADIVVINFEENSQSPITLLELGLLAGAEPHKVVVRCPEEFYRSGNVDIVCSRYGIPVYRDWKEFNEFVEARICDLIQKRRQVARTTLTKNPEDKHEFI